MASEEKVKRYLAYWFQLGKKIVINNGQETVITQKIFNGNKYSDEFEQIWQKVNDSKNGDCYLENTIETIQELLSSRWDIMSCSRCEMPVPMIDLGMQSNNCTCSDLDNWPNNELPPPRDAIDSKYRLLKITNSLARKNMIDQVE